MVEFRYSVPNTVIVSPVRLHVTRDEETTVTGIIVAWQIVRDGGRYPVPLPAARLKRSIFVNTQHSVAL